MADTPFKQWYATHKDVLAERRAREYRENPEIRAKAIERSRAYRAAKRGPDKPPGFTHTFVDAATTIGVTMWQLREWRAKNWFPEPYAATGKLWFTENQVGLLTRIKQFFDQNGPRVKRSTQPELDSIVSLIYANW